MDADPLINTYKRYKAGTNRLIKWLTTHAKQSSSHQPVADARSPHLPTKRIAVDDLVKFAIKIVSATDPTIDIPIDILDVTNDVINGRRAACDWYANFTKSQGDLLAKDVLASNARHQYFIGVLQQVFDVLKREVKARRPKRKKQIELSSDTNSLSNLFSHLEVEEPSGYQTPPPQSESSRATKSDTQPVDIELDGGFDQDSMVEHLFAAYCHFTDLFELRLQMRDMWQRYLAGDLTFLTATQIFDQAASMAVMLTDRFESEHPMFTTFDNIIEQLGRQDYVTKARVYTTSTFRVDAARSLPDIHHKARKHDPEFLMMPAWCAIMDFKELREYINADKAKYKGKEPALIFIGHPFRRVLLDIAPDLKGISTQLLFNAKCTDCSQDTVNSPADAFTRQLSHTLDCRCMQTGLVAITTLYMDLYDILGGDLERGIREIVPCVERLEASCKDWKSYNDPAHMRHRLLNRHVADEGPLMYESKRERFMPFRNTAGVTGWRVNDVVSSDDIERDSSCWRKDSWPGAFISAKILRSLPIFTAQAVNLTMHDIQCSGLHLCNQLDLVLAAAHLYNAAKISGAAVQVWPDMDFVIARENEVSRFLGSGDGTVRGAAKQFCLALGMTLPQVTGKSRVAIPVIGNNKSAKMSNISRFTPHDSGLRSMHTSRHRHEKVAWTTLAHKSGLDLDRLYAVIKSYASSVGIKDSVISKQWQETKKLSPSQLLTIVEEIFVEDEAYIHFDLHQFYMRCFNFLFDVLDHHCVFISEKRAIAYSRRQMSFPFMVNEILWDAAALEGTKRGMKDTFLHQVGQMINDMEPSELSVATLQAQKFSSREIPEHLKPAALYADTAVMRPPETLPPSLMVHQVELDEYKRIHGCRTIDMSDTRNCGDPNESDDSESGDRDEDEDGVNLDGSMPDSLCLCCHGKDSIRLFTLKRIQDMQQALREHRAVGSVQDA